MCVSNIVDVANTSSLPPASMYSSLVQARTVEPLVSQVNITTSPGHEVY